MTRAADLAKLIAGGGTITVADNSTNITLKSTDDDANVGPLLDLNRDSGSPADSDFLGKIQFSGDDDGGNKLNYAFIDSKILDASNGSEDGQLDISTIQGGSAISRLQFNTATVFNEDSADVDFRVESNGEENMLFVDGGENRVGIGTTGGSGETLTVTKTGADATVRVNGVSGQEASLKLQGNNTITNTFKIASEEDDSGLTIQKWNGSAYVTHLKSDANGHITKPLQPAFLANPAVAGSSPVQTNISSGDTITFGNEVFDQNNDFASNTFTAPVTGKYQFNVGLFLEQVDTDYTELRIKLVTSNRNYDHFDIGSPFPSDRNLQYHLSALADMDASDTAVLQVTFGSGGAQMDVNALTYFSGYLVC
jgi:hypothetical protein